MTDIILQILETIWKISCLVFVCLFFNDNLPYLSDCFLLFCLKKKKKIHSVSCQKKFEEDISPSSLINVIGNTKKGTFLMLPGKKEEQIPRQLLLSLSYRRQTHSPWKNNIPQKYTWPPLVEFSDGLWLFWVR